MNTELLCKKYLSALNEGNADKVLELFTENATIVSPLYGIMPAKNFYSELLSDTSNSKTTLLNIFETTKDNHSVALHFHYEWTLKSGKLVEFECVDVFNLSSDGNKFQKLTIIYDTAPLREDFNETHKARIG